MKIKVFNSRDEQKVFFDAWAEKNNQEMVYTDQDITLDSIKDLEGVDGIVATQLARLDDKIYPLLKEAGIKQIAQASAGYDMYNLALAKENDIIITNVPSYSPESIAEYVLAAVFSHIRQMPVIEKHVEEHNFSWEMDIRGEVVGQKTVAIIGTGRIGREAARLFKGIGSKVIGYDVYPSEEAKKYLTYVDSVEEAVEQADIISLHMPLFDNNKHMFDAEMFNHFKKNAILVNMARGGLVDTEALIEALDEGKLSHAILDTYEFEMPYVPHHFEGKEIEDELFKKILTHDKITYTPHIAYYTDEAVRNLVETAADAAVEVLTTGDSKNRVN